jgi:hypothetical protein
MVDWEGRVREHQAFKTLGAIEERLPHATSAADSEQADHLDRIRRVTTQLRRLLDDADPTLITPRLLTEIEANIAAVPDLLEEYAGEPNTATLERVNALLDDLIDDVGWPLAYAGQEPEDMRDAAQSYRRSLGQLVRALQREVDEVGSQLPGVVEAAEQQRTAVEAEAAAAKEEIQSAAAGARKSLSSLEQRIERQSARLDSIVTDYNAQFLKGQSDRTERADTVLQEEVAKFESAREAAETAHQEAIEQLQEDAAKGLAEIEQLKENAQTLVNTIGAIGTAGGYGSYADQQRRMANIWGIAAATSLVILMIIGALIVWATLGDELDWTQIGLRALVSVPVFVFFAFSARELTRHRRNEQDARRKELELAAIDPYLVLLGPEKQAEIKAQLALKMFAQASPGTPQDDEEVTPLIDRLLDLIKEVSKR